MKINHTKRQNGKDFYQVNSPSNSRQKEYQPRVIMEQISLPKKVGNSSHIPKSSGSPSATKVVQIPPTFGSGVLALIWYQPEAISFIMANLTTTKNNCKYDFFLPFDICCYALQSLTGKYREIQGKLCNQNREPAMRTGFPCNESRFFPVGIDLQGKAVSCTGFGFTVLYQY